MKIHAEAIVRDPQFSYRTQQELNSLGDDFSKKQRAKFQKKKIAYIAEMESLGADHEAIYGILRNISDREVAKIEEIFK